MDFLNNIIEEDVKKGIMPGMTYGIVTNDGITIGGAGYKKLVPEKEGYDIDTLYDMASLSKVITTVTLASKLIDQKKINLNDKVKKYLPKFKYDDVTIFNLLTHTSGLPADLEGKEIISREETLKKVYGLDKEYDTGTKVIYSDIGFILLGELISSIYNKPLDEVARTEIFEPLEMYNTCYNPKDKSKCAPTEITDKRGMVQGIVHDEKACSLGGVAGNAGVFTNAKDISNFLSMILNNGVYNGKRFLSKEVIDLWFEPLVFEKQNNRYRSLCWIVGINNIVIKKPGNVISFSGFTGPSLSIDRDNNIAIALLTNRVHPTRSNNLIASERANIANSIYKELGLESDIIRRM